MRICGLEPLHTHGINADDLHIPRDTHAFAVSFAGYDEQMGRDDLVYIAVNTYWEDVTITLPTCAGTEPGI